MSEPTTLEAAPSPRGQEFRLDKIGVIAGLGTALCFGISPLWIRLGLAQVASPLLAVTIGMIANTVVYALLILVRYRQTKIRAIALPREALWFQLLATLFVAGATWARYIALDGAAAGIVEALGRLSVPMVLILAPIVVGKHLERVTPRVWAGAVLILIGSALLLFFN